MLTNKLVSLLYYMGATKYFRAKKNAQNLVTVLSLHRVSPIEDPCWQPLHPHSFEELLKYISKNYTATTFNQLLELPKKTSKPALVLSFDDGYKDFMQYALPLLEKYGLPCNHNFVIDCLENNMTIWTQRLNAIFNHAYYKQLSLVFELPEAANRAIDFKQKNWYQQYIQLFHKILQLTPQQRTDFMLHWEKTFGLPTHTESMMNWEDLKLAYQSKLVEVGSHTFSHPPLPTLIDQPTQLHKEIVASKNALENALNVPIDILSLPNGQNHPDVQKNVQNAGYKHLLEIGESTCARPAPNQSFHVYQRINLVQEPHTNMLCRVEEIQSKLKNIF